MNGLSEARLGLLFLVMLLIGCSASKQKDGASSPAERSAPKGSAEALSERYVQAFMLCTDAQSRLTVLQEANASTDAAWLALAGESDTTPIDPASKQALERTVVDSSRDLRVGLSQYNETQKSLVAALRKRWIEARSRRNQLELELVDVKAHEQVSGQLASLVSLDNRWFWLSGVLALTALVVVATHDRRHEYRRALHGARARAVRLSLLLQVGLVTLFIFAATVFLLGNQIYRALVGSAVAAGMRTKEDMENEIATLQKSYQTLNQQLSEAEALHLKQLNKWIQQSIANDSEAADVWRQIRQGSLRRFADSLSRESLIAALDLDVDLLQKRLDERQSNLDKIWKYQLVKWSIGAGIGLVLTGAVGAGAFLLNRGIRRRKHDIAETCPLCLGRGCFEVVDVAHDAAATTAQMIRCTNVISENTHEECEFSFMSIYREMPKLCFPTLGHVQAGKTHWLAMLYRELNRGNYNADVNFEKVKSQSSEDFDGLVDQILNSRMSTGATQVDRLPRPLIFNFCDRDRWGKSNVLVNLFDYSGEVLQRTLDDPHRRRALNADGYLFFLDPTYLSDPQAEALVNFREDLRVIRGVGTGRSIRTPVALCVSKIDLLVNQSYADRQGGGSIDEFYRQLANINQAGDKMSLKAIEQRSQLVAKLRNTIWPGWEIERQIHELFGGRYMFFPLTPVGLSNLGETDLRQRVIEPFGILEPIAWLLHMNGYPVLK